MENHGLNLKDKGHKVIRSKAEISRELVYQRQITDQKKLLIKKNRIIIKGINKLVTKIGMGKQFM